MRILVYQRYPYYRFVPDFAADFAATGHVVRCVPAAEGPQLRRHAAEWKPDCVFCVGASPAVGRALSGRVPIIYYELDKILNVELFTDAPPAPADRVFVTYRGDEALFRGFGFRHVAYLPFCVNVRPEKEPRAPRCDPPYGVSFVGSLVRQQNNEYRQLVQAMIALAARDAGRAAVLRELLAIFEAVLAEQERHFAEGEYVVPERLRAALRPELVQTLVGLKIPLDAAIHTLGKEAAGRQRHFWLQHLAAADLWGSEAPASAGDWRYHGAIEQYGGVSEVFSGSEINLNLQRIYARDGLSDRVFNVLHAGGCLLADRTEPLTALFSEGEEIATYASPEEFAAQAERLHADPEYRLRLAANGQRRVWERHLFRHRIPTLLEAFA